MVGQSVRARTCTCGRPEEAENAWIHPQTNASCYLHINYVRSTLPMSVCILWMSKCTWACVSRVARYGLWAHFSQKSKLNGSSITRICDWDTSLYCVCSCVHTYSWSPFKGVWCKGGSCACTRVRAHACVRWSLVFAWAMINGLHWAVQPCMFLGLSFSAVSN